MTVILLRHFKVDYRWKPTCTPEEYRLAQTGYDQADVINQRKEVPRGWEWIVTSTLKRAIQTARYLCQDCNATQTSLLNEVPMAPFSGAPRRHWTITLNLAARLQWFLNLRQQPETRAQTIQRANAFIDGFLARGPSCLVVGHGLFLQVLSRQMLRRGFKGRPIGYLTNGEYCIYRLPEGNRTRHGPRPSSSGA